ncbi:hypothetical protein PPYR_04783 [Photinus pyralis]|uniref:Mutator-like transposase domain-containing protein n=1 Tax=Photinus pyralis TaxID=7054 RepID=A0A5N4AZ20_PHOPY|nr:hypothetical protein PPYR_04783 [Photinus pyralis]
MEANYRRGAKTRLRLSIRRKKSNNIYKYNAARAVGLPCSTKNILPTSRTTEKESILPNVEIIANITESSPESPEIEKRKTVENNDFPNEEEIFSATEPSLAPIVKGNKRNSTSAVSIDGLRVVDLQKFIESLKTLSTHSTLFGCSLVNLQVVKELKVGYQTKLTFKCDMCGFSKSIHTCPESPQSVDVNTSAVTAVMNVGGGYTQLVNITGAMNIPSLSFSLYKKIHSEICTAWEDLAWKSMKEAAEEEKMIALQCGSVDVNGTPMITVVGDGSWAKRSYRGTGNYNSLSGTAAIVGLKSKKILYLGVKNKYCCVCQRAKNIGTEAAAHTCYKNWNLSSTAMEANIIAEGFCASLEMYGLIYNKLIADGDSSCYKKLLDSRPYETCTVEKIECSNHLLRNYCNKLKELSKMRGIPGSLKNILSNNILRCRTAVVKAIKYRRSEANTSLEDNIKNLRKDIINSVSHIFGEHLNCSELRYFCEKTEPDQNNYMSDFRTLNLDEKLMDAVRYLAGHSRSLLENVTTNVVEQFNSIIAQKLGGKRVNYTQRRCYQGRCYCIAPERQYKKWKCVN